MQLFSKNEPMPVSEIAVRERLSESAVKKYLRSGTRKLFAGLADLVNDREVRELATAVFNCDDEEL